MKKDFSASTRLALLFGASLMLFAVLSVFYIDIVNLIDFVLYNKDLKTILSMEEHWQTQIAIFNTGYGALLRMYKSPKDKLFSNSCANTGRYLVIIGVYMALFMLLTHVTAHVFILGWAVNILELLVWAIINMVLLFILFSFVWRFSWR